MTENAGARHMGTGAGSERSRTTGRDPAEFDTLSNIMSAALANNWWAVALRGVLAILFGLVALLLPGATLLSFVLLFAAYMLVDGVLTIVSAVRAAQRRARWGLLALEGAVSIIAGILAVLWPRLTVVAFAILIGAWAIVSGGLMMGAAFRLNLQHGRWWLGLAGILSLMFGTLMVLAPLVGAVVLTWWLGAFAITLGIILLVLAYRLWSMDRLHAGVQPVRPTV